MIYIDRRTGSKDLKPMIGDSLLVTLPYGDVAFYGYGPMGDVCVGVERKTILDLVNSISTGRLSAHQLPGMVGEYDVSYLIVEGVWKGDDEDSLLISKTGGKTFHTYSYGRQRWTWSGVHHYLMSAEIMFGVHIRHTKSARDTARTIRYLAAWWGKEWGRHRSHVALHKDVGKFNGTGKVDFMTAIVNERPSLLRKIVAELPGISVDRSLAVDKYFEGSLKRMWEADEKEWTKVPGIGKITAKMCWEALHT